MKCFYHNELDAVGICKSCSKGICSSCALDVGNGIACAGCVDTLKSLNQLVSRNVRLSVVNKRATYLWPVFFMVMGVAFIGGSIAAFGHADAMSISMGVIFIVLGAIQALLLRAARAGT